MKHLMIIFFSAIVFCSYGQAEEKIENILLNCLINSYSEIQVDLNKELNELEKYLVDNGTLKSTTGQSYYDFYMQVVGLNDIPGNLDIDKFDNLYKLRPNEYYAVKCLQDLTKIDSVEIANSKYFQMTIKMQEVTASGEISPSTIASSITSVLTPSDFGKPYYRAIALLTIANTSNIKTGLVRTLKPPKSIDYSRFPSVSILANEKNEIIYNDKTINKETLRSELYSFIKQNQTKHLIVFSSEKGTTYNSYLKVQDFILEVYSSLREEKSKEFYNKSFAELTEKEKGEIVKIYPKNIKEQ